mgnify:CR=1 FL=1
MFRKRAALHHHRLAIVLFWLVPACFAASSGGQSSTGTSEQPTQAALEAWFEAELVSPTKLPDYGKNRVSWIRETHRWPGEAEMARLAREVPGHPDHPERQVFGIYQRRRAGQPTRTPRTAWIADNTTWRLSESFTDPEFTPNSFWDKVVTPRHAISFDHGSITIIDPTEGYPIGQNLASIVGELFENLAIMSSGGLSQIRRDVVVESLQADAQGDWRATLTTKSTSGNAPAREYLVTGRWDATANRGFTERISRIDQAAPNAAIAKPGPVAIAKDWKLDPILNLWFSERTEIYGIEGRLDHVFIFEGATAETNGTFDQAFDIPKQGSQDSFRGEVKVLIYNDLRTGKTTRYLPDGRETIDEINSVFMSPNSGTSAFLRIAGWTTAGAIICFLVWYKLRRVSQHSSSKLN